MYSDNDIYQSMETFRLRWRWDKQHCPELCKQDRLNIRPLTAFRAATVWRASQPLYYSSNGMVRPNMAVVSQLNTATKESAEIRGWLDTILPTTEDAILILWDPSTAVETNRITFLNWWDTFCYPASDDVRIRPLSSSWAACYGHEEVFYVGKPI